MTDELREALGAITHDQSTFLVTEYGKPFSDNGFGNKMRQWCNDAGLPECSSHGLRKASATILAEAGATEHQLMAIFGWSDSHVRFQGLRHRFSSRLSAPRETGCLLQDVAALRRRLIRL